VVTKKESIVIQKQQILTDTKLASLFRYMGYTVTVKIDPLGPQYLVADPGDLQDAIKSYKDGAQVADSKKLLESYDSLRGQAGAPVGEKIELRPAKIETVPGREWSTRDFQTAQVLHFAGYELLKTRIESGKVVFIFSYDESLKTIIKQFNAGSLVVEPRSYAASGYIVRDALRDAKQWRASAPPPSGFSLDGGGSR